MADVQARASRSPGKAAQRPQDGRDWPVGRNVVFADRRKIFRLPPARHDTAARNASMNKPQSARRRNQHRQACAISKALVQAANDRGPEPSQKGAAPSAESIAIRRSVSALGGPESARSTRLATSCESADKCTPERHRGTVSCKPRAASRSERRPIQSRAQHGEYDGIDRKPSGRGQCIPPQLRLATEDSR